jgi:hypothetical protein
LVPHHELDARSSGKLPPPIVSVPALTLSGFVALMILSSAVAVGASLVAVGRVGVASALREP